jgi:hypothetical protein
MAITKKTNMKTVKVMTRGMEYHFVTFDANQKAPIWAHCSADKGYEVAKIAKKEMHHKWKPTTHKKTKRLMVTTYVKNLKKKTKAEIKTTEAKLKIAKKEAADKLKKIEETKKKEEAKKIKKVELENKQKIETWAKQQLKKTIEGLEVTLWKNDEKSKNEINELKKTIAKLQKKSKD